MSFPKGASWTPEHRARVEEAHRIEILDGVQSERGVEWPKDWKTREIPNFEALAARIEPMMAKMKRKDAFPKPPRKIRTKAVSGDRLEEIYHVEIPDDEIL